MKFPKIILLSDLLKSVTISKGRLSEISSKTQNETLDELHCHGLFVLAISTIETMMNDVILYLLQAVPEKMNFQECKVQKDELIGSIFTYDIITRQSLKEVTSSSYKNIEQYIEYFCKVTSINQIVSGDRINEFKEIKESRNLLLHNNLQVNEIYKTKAGPCARNPNRNGKLKIDIDYLQKSIICIQDFIGDIELKLIEKYKKYTKLFLLKSTWDCLFDSPIMKFEDYWHIDEKKDSVFALKKCKYEEGLSSGETSLLSLWRSLFTGNSDHLKTCWFQQLSASYKEKALFLILLSERTSLW